MLFNAELGLISICETVSLRICCFEVENHLKLCKVGPYAWNRNPLVC